MLLSNPPPLSTSFTTSRLSTSCVDALVVALSSLPSSPSAVSVTPLLVPPSDAVTAPTPPPTSPSTSPSDDQTAQTLAQTTQQATTQQQTQTQSSDDEVIINTDDAFEIHSDSDKDSDDQAQATNAGGKSLSENKETSLHKKSLPQSTVGWVKRFNTWLSTLPAPVLVLGATVVALLLILFILFVFHCVLECTSRNRKDKTSPVRHKPTLTPTPTGTVDAANDPLVSVEPDSPYFLHYHQTRAATTSSSLPGAVSSTYVSTRTSNKITEKDEEFADLIAGGSSSLKQTQSQSSARERLLAPEPQSQPQPQTSSSLLTDLEAGGQPSSSDVLFDSDVEAANSKPATKASPLTDVEDDTDDRDIFS